MVDDHNIRPLAAILLNYNSSKDCETCIQDLKRQMDVTLEIVIVDNCSSPEELSQIRTICDNANCTFIENHDNRGYSAGNNVGLRYAVNKGYKYVAICNPDMLLPDNKTLKVLYDAMEKDPGVAISAPNTLCGKRHQNPMLGLTYKEELLWPFLKFMSKSEDYESSRYCYALCGCFLFIRSSFLLTIGFLDENTFLFGEEAILSKQVQLTKMKMLFVAETTAIHNHIEKKKGNIVARVNSLRKSKNYYYATYCKYPLWKKILLQISQELWYANMILIFKFKSFFSNAYNTNK